MKCLAGHEESEREAVKAQEKWDRGAHVQARPCGRVLGWGGQAFGAGLRGADSHPKPSQKEQMQEGIEGGEVLRELEQCLIIKLIS